MGPIPNNDELLTGLFPDRSVKRVLLIAPPDADESLFDFGTAKRGRYWNYPPYGLGVIAAHLQQDNIDVEILNLNNHILMAAQNAASASEFNFSEIVREKLASTIDEFSPDLMGITCLFSQTHQSMIDVCTFASQHGDRSIPIALGGVHVTNSFSTDQTRKVFLNDLGAADLFFLYEAEVSIRIFIQCVNKKCSTDKLNQVVFLNTNPLVVIDELDRPEKGALDLIPSHQLMRSDQLSEHGKIGGFYSLLDSNAKITTVLSNRGCRAQCTFCSVRNFNGIGVRRRNVQSVIDELLMLRNDFGIDHVMWLDDDFLYRKKESLELLNAMVQQNVGLTWDCTNGVIAASCTNEMMHAAAESGCIGLTIGMESGNPTILKQIRKPGTTETFLRAAEVLRGITQINARVFLMIGFPGETYSQISDTIEVAREMGLDWYNVTILQPLPNTPIFEEMTLAGLLSDTDFSDVRYNSGQYGKHRKMAENNHDPLSVNFKDAFNDVDLNSIPTGESLDDIWAYMNYHLNFRRLFDEQRQMKLAQQLRYVENIAELVAPNNAFALYFTAYLQHRINGDIKHQMTRQLDMVLRESPYWRARCEEFDLQLTDLTTANFQRHTSGPQQLDRDCTQQIRPQ